MLKTPMRYMWPIWIIFYQYKNQHNKPVVTES